MCTGPPKGKAAPPRMGPWGMERSPRTLHARAQRPTPRPPPPALQGPGTGRHAGGGGGTRREGQGGLCVWVTCPPPQGGAQQSRILQERCACTRMCVCVCVCKSRRCGGPRGRTRPLAQHRRRTERLQGTRKHNRTVTGRHLCPRPHSSQGQQTNSVST